jgi:uncharacterized protein (DUF1810 family)
MMEHTSNRFDLQRFVIAQQPVYATALAELKAGDKRSHWMWFIFPQAAGLGHSATAQRYAIGSMDEARAYLAHPLLGPAQGVHRGGAERDRQISARYLRFARRSKIQVGDDVVQRSRSRRRTI